MGQIIGHKGAYSIRVLPISEIPMGQDFDVRIDGGGSCFPGAGCRLLSPGDHSRIDIKMKKSTIFLSQSGSKTPYQPSRTWALSLLIALYTS